MKAIKYIAIEDESDRYSNIYIEMRSENAWAIIKSGCCMNKEGYWEYEPFPSSRGDEFIKRTRFKNEHDAMNFLNRKNGIRDKGLGTRIVRGAW